MPNEHEAWVVLIYYKKGWKDKKSNKEWRMVIGEARVPHTNRDVTILVTSPTDSLPFPTL